MEGTVSDFEGWVGSSLQYETNIQHDCLGEEGGIQERNEYGGSWTNRVIPSPTVPGQLLL